ncbi:MAG: glucoamylase, partial [Actinomycetota bacterium]|nr:glucoamylase [Actinomycetota bacterium]
MSATIAAISLAALSLGSATASAAPPTEASGAPGAVSHQAQSRKDCVGTARNTTSRIWFTIANGILSDV